MPAQAQIPLGSSRLDTTRHDTLDTTNATGVTRKLFVV